MKWVGPYGSLELLMAGTVERELDERGERVHDLTELRGVLLAIKAESARADSGAETEVD